MIKYLLSNSIMRNVAYVQTIVVGLIVTPIIVRSVGSEGYGQWVLINTLLAYFIIFDFGFSTAIARYVSKEFGSTSPEDIQRYISTALGVLCVALALSLMLVVGGFLIFREEVYRMIPPPMAHAAGVLVISYSVMIPLRVFHGILRAQLKWNVISFIEIAKSLSMNAVLVVLVLKGYGVYALIYCNAAFLMLEYVGYLYFSRRALEFSLSLKFASMGTLRELGGYSLSFFANQMSVVFGRRIQTYFIAYVISVSTVTMYSIGILLLGYFESCMTSVFDIFTPYFSRHERNMNRVLEDYLHVSAYCFAVCGFAGLMIFMYARPFIYHWLGPDFLGAYEVVVFLFVPYVLYLSHIPSRSLLFGTSNQKFLVWLSVIECMVTFLLLVLLIHPYGLQGVLWSMSMTMLVFRGVLFPALLFRTMKLNAFRYIWEVYVRQTAIYLVPQLLIYFFIFRSVDVFSYKLAYVLLLQLLVFGATLLLFVRRDMKHAVSLSPEEV